jgi:hypothetical protein
MAALHNPAKLRASLRWGFLLCCAKHEHLRIPFQVRDEVGGGHAQPQSSKDRNGSDAPVGAGKYRPIVLKKALINIDTIQPSIARNVTISKTN